MSAGMRSQSDKGMIDVLTTNLHYKYDDKVTTAIILIMVLIPNVAQVHNPNLRFDRMEYFQE